MIAELCHRINNELVGVGLHDMGQAPPPDYEFLRSLELEQMLQATQFVKFENENAKAIEGQRLLVMTCDDRLIAAIYTALHYDAEPAAELERPIVGITSNKKRGARTFLVHVIPSDVEGQRICRHCGCSDDIACAGGCSWVSKDECSACVKVAR